MNESDPAVGRELLRDILLNPADDTPRLVYADWLEEYGGKPHTAGFIRAQVEASAHDEHYYLSSRNAYSMKSSAIECFRKSAEAYYAACLREDMRPSNITNTHFNTRPDDWEWRRGFLESVTDIRLEDVVRHRDRVFGNHPVATFKLSTTHEHAVRRASDLHGYSLWTDGKDTYNHIPACLGDWLVRVGMDIARPYSTPTVRFYAAPSGVEPFTLLEKAAELYGREAQAWIYKNS